MFSNKLGVARFVNIGAKKPTTKHNTPPPTSKKIK